MFYKSQPDMKERIKVVRDTRRSPVTETDERGKDGRKRCHPDSARGVGVIFLACILVLPKFVEAEKSRRVGGSHGNMQ